MLNRGDLMKTGLGASAGLALALGAALLLAVSPSAMGAQTPQLPLPPAAIPQFASPLPLLSVAGGPMLTVFGSQPVTVHMCEFKAKVLPAGAVAGYTGTWVWGYLPEASGQTTCEGLIDVYDDGFVNGTKGPLETYIGPVILNNRGTPTALTWINDLPAVASTNVAAWKYSTDQTLHWADPAGDEMNMCNHMAMFPEPGSPCSLNFGEDLSKPGTYTAARVPAVIHLHGGEVPPELDGGPDAWVTSDGAKKGHGFYTFSSEAEPAPLNGAIYKYANTQEAAPVWFHDHALGITRLNVYAGLAGGYLIADPALTLGFLDKGLGAFGLSRNGSVGASEITVPLVIQDRMFDTDGQLFFPADSAAGVLWATNPEHPYWVPEFTGDVIVVNGKAWPNFNVEPKRYRFLFLNGSNSRTYEMFLVDPVTGAAGPNIWVIGTDGGYLDKPVLARKLTMMPGERYEVIIDFAGFANPNGWLLKNTGKTPFPAGAAPQGATLAKIMKFTVGTCTSGNCGAADKSFNPAAAGATIRANGQKIVRLPGTPGGPAVVTATGTTQNVQKTRALTLNEVMGMPVNATDPVTGLPAAYPGGPLEILVNNTKWSGERITGVDATGHYAMEPVPGFAPVTLKGKTTRYSEVPQEGDTEIWEIVNLTADAHPIHLHLVQFQLVSRQAFDTGKYGAAYAAAFPGGGYDPMMGAGCAQSVFCPGFGPPLPYDGSDPRSGGKLGGNPDIATVKGGKPLYLLGKPAPPNAYEAGWKDTVIVYPGQVTRLAVRWAPTDLPVQNTGSLGSLYFPFDPSGLDANGDQHGYVWHCHIIDHEDNEMMRPDLVTPNAAATRTVIKDTNY